MAVDAGIVKEFAGSLGFDPVGITTAEDFPETEKLTKSLVAAGFFDGLPWFDARRAQLACRPRARFPWLRSIVAVAVPYRSTDQPRDCFDRDSDGGDSGRVSSHALAIDYHSLIADKLASLADFLHRFDQKVVTQGYVDTGPLPERALAVRAGLGWFGKNTNVLTIRHGSWVFLGALLTSLELTPDRPLNKSCGRCTRCLDACPTGALVAPYTLDSRRCVSYLTIELRGNIPRDLRAKVGDMIFGCDACQAVCPVNARPSVGMPSPLPRHPNVGRLMPLAQLLEMDEAGFRERFAGSVLLRAKRIGMRRNAVVTMGNLGGDAFVPALKQTIEVAEPQVRAHSAWALGRIRSPSALGALRRAADTETDAAVLDEICWALSGEDH